MIRGTRAAASQDETNKDAIGLIDNVREPDTICFPLWCGELEAKRAIDGNAVGIVELHVGNCWPPEPCAGYFKVAVTGGCKLEGSRY